MCLTIFWSVDSSHNLNGSLLGVESLPFLTFHALFLRRKVIGLFAAEKHSNKYLYLVQEEQFGHFTGIK